MFSYAESVFAVASFFTIEGYASDLQSSRLRRRRSTVTPVQALSAMTA